MAGQPCLESAIVLGDAALVLSEDSLVLGVLVFVAWTLLGFVIFLADVAAGVWSLGHLALMRSHCPAHGSVRPGKSVPVFCDGTWLTLTVS